MCPQSHASNVVHNHTHMHIHTQHIHPHNTHTTTHTHTHTHTYAHTHTTNAHTITHAHTYKYTHTHTHTHTHRFVSKMPTPALFISFSFLLKAVEGIGLTMFATGSLTLLTQLYLERKGTFGVRILAINFHYRYNSDNCHFDNHFVADSRVVDFAHFLDSSIDMFTLNILTLQI